MFRANTDLVLLTTRMRMDPDGKPHLPGGLDVWKNLFAGKTQAKFDPKLAKAAPGWKDSEGSPRGHVWAVERKVVENEALKIYMALDRYRAQPFQTARYEHRRIFGPRL